MYKLINNWIVDKIIVTVYFKCLFFYVCLYPHIITLNIVNNLNNYIIYTNIKLQKKNDIE